MHKSAGAIWQGADLLVDDNLSQLDRLCQAYNYPLEIRDLFGQITSSVAVPGTRSVVLSGSGSRGELVYAPTPLGLSMFSDLELTVVGDDLKPEEIRKSLSRLETIEERQRRVGARPFHIDVDFIPSKEWQRKQHKFQAWETKTTGWTLFGENILGLINVDVKPQTAVQSSLNRLWYLLLYFPERILRRDPIDEDLQVFTYALSRAVLDFPLWLLVKGGIQVSGFAGRQKYLSENREDFRRQQFPIDELIALVDTAMQLREFPRMKGDLLRLYQTVLQWYPRMISWTLTIPPTAIDSASFPEVLQKHSHELYPALNWKRFAWETRMVTEIGGTPSPALALKWLREKKQVLITTFLWFMHQAVAQHLAGGLAEANKWLQSAFSTMEALWPAHRVHLVRDAFIENWTALRRCFFDFIMLFYRGLKAKESYYREVLNAC